MAKKSTKKVEKVVEPILLDCGKEIKSWKGETFELVKSNKGILYHVFGGFNIFVTPNNIALYETLDDLIENQETYNNLTGQEREDFDLHLSALTYVLDVPLFAFSNAEFTYEIAEKVVKFLQKVYDDAIKEPLKDETPDEDLQFKEAVLGLEDVKNALKEEIHE
jgi:hypothetical protein